MNKEELGQEGSEINMNKRNNLLEERAELKEKLYLSEIFDLEQPEFKSNNLILAPVGSGKTRLIETKLIPKDYDGNVLYLVSNTTLKDSICPNDNKQRENMANLGKSQRMFTSGNKTRFGNNTYNIHVMTYHEFGERVYSPAPSLVDDVEFIFCDEIHSLPIYHSYDTKPSLTAALLFLFAKHENITIYYFTATVESIDKLEFSRPGFTKAITVYNYLDHPKIRKYVSNSTYYINYIEQIRPHLRAKLQGFDYYGYKGLAFSKLIADQEKIANIAKEEGFKPIVLWSINNENKMNDEQLRVRKEVLTTGLIPNEYNLLIINGAMQEGWDLNDPDMRLAIMDTTDETEQVQALGRIRQDIELLICKTKDNSLGGAPFEIPEQYLDVLLTPELKEDLCRTLNILNSRGKYSKWTTIKKLIIDSNYTLTEKMINVNDRRRSCAIITLDREVS